MGSEDHIASKTLQAWSASPIAMVMGSVYLEMEMGVVA
jgi:TRAP-type C4-dicarboxylate transport system substrate-binding protein